MCVSPWPSQPSDLGFEVGKPARWRKISTPTAARDTGRPWLGWLCEYRALCLLPNCPNMKPDSHATGGSAARRSPVLSWMIQHRRAYWSQPFSTHSNASVGCCVLPKVKWFLKELLATRSGGGGEKERETRQRGRRRRDKKKRECHWRHMKPAVPADMMMTWSHFKTTYKAENYGREWSSSLFVLLLCDTLSQQWRADGCVRENQWQAAHSVHCQNLQLVPHRIE